MSGSTNAALPASGASAAGLRAASASKGVLLTLAAAQFLTTLDSSVMNVSIAYVSRDVHTTVTGVQAAITTYALVMAALMITGGKIGAMIGRRRAFSIGCVIYGAGALVTSFATSLPVLIIGWSLIEGIGAALIMPAGVALVAVNFAPERRPAAYGLLTAACAMAVAAGPIIGGAITTFASWRWVFAGETIIVLVILALTRRIVDNPPTGGRRLDFVGVGLSIVGLASVVFGVLKTSEWGWVQKVGAPKLFDLSPSLWLILGGLVVCYVFLVWERHLERRGGEPLIKPSMLENRQLTGGLLMSLFQFLTIGGLSFVVPLFLSIVLGLSALQTGVWLLPLSVSLLISASVVPRAWRTASPRALVRIGLMLTLVGVLLLMIGIEPGAGAWVVAVPLALVGLGAGCMASQIGAVTVSAVPDEQSAEVGGLQNTVQSLGSSLATALTGSVLIAALSASFLAGIVQSPQVPEAAKKKAQVHLAAGVPFVSDVQVRAQLKKEKVPAKISKFLVNDNAQARVKGLHISLSLVALLCVIGLFFTGRLPRSAIGGEDSGGEDSGGEDSGGEDSGGEEPGEPAGRTARPTGDRTAEEGAATPVPGHAAQPVGD